MDILALTGQTDMFGMALWGIGIGREVEQSDLGDSKGNVDYVDCCFFSLLFLLELFSSPNEVSMDAIASF